MKRYHTVGLIPLVFIGRVCAGNGIPFEAALDEARVELSSLASGRRDSPMPGNGDRNASGPVPLQAVGPAGLAAA